MSNHLLLAPVPSTSSVTSSASKHLLKTKPMLALAALLALAGCSNGQNETNETASSDTTKTSEAADNNSAASDDDNVLRIGTEGAYAPFNYTNADGTLGGFDVEIANAICDDLQMTCEIIAQDWDGIIPGLKAGKYDAIVAAMSVTPERAKQVAFTDPYFSNALVFLAKRQQL